MIERTPLACDLTGFSDAEQDRREELIEQLRPSIVESHDLDSGFGISFDPSISLVAVAELIGLERRCCPFLSFQLVVPEAHAPVRLEIAGRDGVKEFIIAELRLPGAAVE